MNKKIDFSAIAISKTSDSPMDKHHLCSFGNRPVKDSGVKIWIFGENSIFIPKRILEKLFKLRKGQTLCWEFERDKNGTYKAVVKDV